MSIENIDSGEQRAAFAAIWLMLMFFGVAEKISFREQRSLAFQTIERIGSLNPSMANTMGCTLVRVSFEKTSECLIAARRFTSITTMLCAF